MRSLLPQMFMTSLMFAFMMMLLVNNDSWFTTIFIGGFSFGFMFSLFALIGSMLGNHVMMINHKIRITEPSKLWFDRVKR